MSEGRATRTSDWELPGHDVRKVLKHVPNQGRTVLLTRYGGTDCVTRVWHSPVSVHQHEYLYRIAAGHPTDDCPFPADLVSDLEGYRVRASLGPLRFLPEVVNVGLVRRELNAEAQPYISTRWVEGRPLHTTWRKYDVETRKRILRQILRALAELHSRNVLHGDLKAENVVVGDGTIALIDLDTLRQVPDRESPVPVSQLTALYSSPEQSHERQAYLTSDLFAYGVLVALLLGDCRPGQPGFPPRLDAPWDAVVEGCLREKPQDRPSAEELMRGLGEEGAPPRPEESIEKTPVAIVTVRVPDTVCARPPQGGGDPAATERVEDGGASTPPPRPRHRRGRTAGRLARVGSTAVPLAVAALGAAWEARPRRVTRRGLALTGLVALLLAATLWLPHLGLAGGPPEDSRITELRAQLRQHKTQLASNNGAFLAPIVVASRDVADAEALDAAWGVYALARVWQQGWQYTGTRWNPGVFAEGDALTGQALEMATTPEALLARAVLTGAACRLAPGSYARRADHCAESRLRSDQALEALKELERAQHLDVDWLRVEALWNAALVERARASHRQEAGRKRETARHVKAGLGYCDAARKILPASPINGVEMAEDCIVIASRARDAEAWLWWVRWVVQHGDEAGKDRARLAAHVFDSVDPRCAGHPPALLQARFASPGHGALEYCAYMAHMALGCPEQAARFVCPSGAVPPCDLPSPTDDVPWDFASVVRDQAVDLTCAIP